MSAFSPTPQFSKRWLDSPKAVKEAFHQELDDIIAMLKSDTPAHQFQFKNADFGSSVSQLLKHNTSAPTKLVHGLDTRLTQDSNHHKPNNPPSDEMIYAKLSGQIDDFLMEHTAQLADDLKHWLKDAIKNELSR